MTDLANLRVLSVVSEIFPLVKTGGLADVTGALPLALREHGVGTVSLVPGYPSVLAALKEAETVHAFDQLFGGPARILSARVAGHDLLVIEARHLFDRPGNPYFDADGRDWPDNALRFGALGWVAARVALGDIPKFQPDIVHCHDWQAGLTLAYLAYDGRGRPPSIITVHNLAFQGLFPYETLSALQLPPSSFQVDGVEFYGHVSFLKAGLQFADRITTVSTTYAAEMQTPEHGFGLDGLLRARSGLVTGIVNGIDTEIWNPKTDSRLPARFDPKTIAKRARNKQHVQRHFRLNPEPEPLLFGIVSRLAWQKGLDILADAVPSLLDMGAQLAVLGAGEAELERRIFALAEAHPGRIGCIIGYNEDLAHLMQAGVDSIVVPSRYEPCGLTQLCALRYGAIPVVANVGGLADTVLDPLEITSGKACATGFHFSPVSREALEAALARTRDLWSRQAEWRRMQRSGMRTDVSWTKSASQYADVYRDLLTNASVR
jgi:starch synthase